MKLVSRSHEQSILEDFVESNQAEFLAIYGRRRIGKTYLVRQYFKNNKKVLFCNVTGSKNTPLNLQVERFIEEVSKTFYRSIPLQKGKRWDDAFKILTKALEEISPRKKVILFFDEFPWMATKNSRLLGTLDYYWNQHWSQNKRVKLIICGSSASWIVKNIINNKGGLHNRITKKIKLEPFKLDEVEDFLKDKKLTRSQIVQLYMVTGGIPYYLTHIKNGLSIAQNVDFLAFGKDGLLVSEFDNLFSSLFENAPLCKDLIRLINKKKSGVSQEDILKNMSHSGQTKGGTVLKNLEDLEMCGFIKRFKPYLHKRRGVYYKIIDEYTAFYLNWIDPIKDQFDEFEEGYWEKQQGSSQWCAWAGYNFEALCYKHINKIKSALKIKASAITSTWRFSSAKPNQNGAQIDLLFDRTDDTISLCEIKYTQKPFKIDSTFLDDFQSKTQVFKAVTRTKKQIFWTLISAAGVQRSKHVKELSNVITLDDLF